MGEVYRAVDTRLRRKVALKVLRTDDAKNPDGVARLFREARAAAALSHPNTVAIHDLGESEDGLFYIVMELVSGQPLLAYVGDDRVSLARRLKWLGEMAKALATAHKAGVIHRDVKPSNVMVSEEDVAKVLDFGLAKPMPKASGEPDSFGFKTAAGRVLGTIRYMAPEQMIGSEADGRSDQYSLGMTAFELIAGRYPPGKAFEIPPLLNTLVADFPEDGALAIARMLKRIPEDRFSSMEDVVSAFEDLAANRPVRALSRLSPEVKISDRTVLDAPNKYGPETVPENPAGPIGSTLTSVLAAGTIVQGSERDEISVDSQFAIEDALQPTALPDQLLAQKIGLEPAPAEPKPSPKAEEPVSKPAASSKAQSSTLQSADAGKRIRELREASKVPKEPPKEATIIEVPVPAAKPSEPKIGMTLASKDDEMVKAVRAASKKAAPIVESVPPPKPEVAQPAKKSNVVWIVVAIAVLAIAAFSGFFLGARSR